MVIVFVKIYKTILMYNIISSGVMIIMCVKKGIKNNVNVYDIIRSNDNYVRE